MTMNPNSKSVMPKSCYSKRGCCVLGCFSSGTKLKKWSQEECFIHHKQREFCPCTPPYELLPFPTVNKNPDLRIGWTRCVNRQLESGEQWCPNADSRICTLHFIGGHPHPVKDMGHTNIPNQFLPTKRKQPTPRFNKISKVSKTENVAQRRLDYENPNAFDACTVNIDHDYDFEWRETKCEGCDNRSAKIHMLMETIKSLRKENQQLRQKCKTNHKIRENDSLFKIKGKMMIYTGMEKKVFDTVYECVGDKAKKITYWKGPSRTVNKLKKSKPGPSRHLTPKNEMLLAMMKIKTGLHMGILGDLFGISASQVSRICLTWWKFLDRELGELIFNPPKHAVVQTVPLAFNHPVYRDVRHIIDCTEIFIETPKSLDLQASCWSNYKHHHTVKYLVSINPNGHINFVSRGWVGRASDNHVTERCGWLDILEPYDKVMGDRGFQIQKLLAQRFVTLVIPPGRKGEHQMTEADVTKTQAVANRGIYVEQAIRRIKSFKMLQNEVPITLLHSLDSVLRIASGICNLRVPLAK